MPGRTTLTSPGTKRREETALRNLAHTYIGADADMCMHVPVTAFVWSPDLRPN